MVVISHVRHLVLVDFREVQQKTIFQKGFYFVTGLGHEAVVVFFVISGFLVGALTLNKWQCNGPDLRSYASARISRIYTVLIPALLIGLALDTAGFHWYNASELYTNSAKYNTISLSAVVSEGIGVSTFMGNLLMLQGIFTHQLGSNGPLWSLSFEWWYYCAFALIAASLTQPGKRRIAYAVAGALLMVALPIKILLWGAIWVLGIVASAWIGSRVWRPHPLIGLVCFLVVLVASRLSHNADNLTDPEPLLIEFARDFAVGLAFVTAMVSSTRIRAVHFARLHEQLADFSYTTYLFHFPAMLLLVAAANQVFALPFRVQPQGYGLSYAVGLTAVLYLYCFAWSRLTEQHTTAIRRRLDALFGITRRVPITARAPSTPTGA